MEPYKAPLQLHYIESIHQFCGCHWNLWTHKSVPYCPLYSANYKCKKQRHNVEKAFILIQRVTFLYFRYSLLPFSDTISCPCWSIKQAWIFHVFGKFSRIWNDKSARIIELYEYPPQNTKVSNSDWAKSSNLNYMINTQGYMLYFVINIFTRFGMEANAREKLAEFRSKLQQIYFLLKNGCFDN